MAKLPDSTALGEVPQLQQPRRTPMLATYRPTTGFEDTPANELAFAGSQLSEGARFAEQAQEQQDNLRVEDAFTQLRGKQIDMTYGKDGFANLKGGNAVNAPVLKDYGGAFDQAAQQISGTLGNDYQRQLFQKRAQVAGLQLREGIVRHVAEQTNVYAETAFKSGIDMEAKMMGDGWQSPDSAPMSMKRMGELIDRQADWQGLQGDVRKSWVAEQTRAAVSKGRSAEVMSALVSDPVKGPFAAEAILKLHANDIEAAQRVVLTHEVKSAIQPIEVASDAERAVKGVLGTAGADVQIDSKGVNQAVADQTTPATFSFRNPKTGAIEEGTASSADVAVKYGRSVLGLAAPDTLPKESGGTKRDVAALLGDAIAQARQNAAETHPGDLVYADKVVTSVKGYFGTIIAAHDGQQKGAIEGILKVIANPDGPPVLTKEQLLGNPQARAAYDSLDPSQQLGIDGHIHSNLLRAQGVETHVAPATTADLSARIFLPSDNPNRIRNINQLVPYLDPNNPQHINPSTFGFLSGLIDKSQSVNGQKFAVAAQRAYQSAKSTLAHSLVGSVNADAAADGANQYYIELQNKIDQYQTEGKDPRTLLTPGTPDSMVDRAKVMSYLQITPKQAVAADAEKGKPPAQRGTKTPAEGSASGELPQAEPGYEIGKVYPYKQGNYEYLGGPIGKPSSFRKVQ